MVPVKDISGGATFAVKVHPRARKNAITGTVGDAVKLALTAPPVERETATKTAIGTRVQAPVTSQATLLALS